MSASYLTWSWEADDGTPVYVACQKITKAGSPPDVMFVNRFRLDSPIAHWLRQFTEQPRLGRIGSQPMSRVAAEALFTLTRRTYLEAGYKLLSNRPIGSWTPNDGKPRAVVDPNGDIHLSARQAAHDAGVNISTIVRRIARDRNQPNGWRYI